MQEQRERLLDLIPPDRYALVGSLRAHVDESMIRQIADADYGSNSDGNYCFLRKILDVGGWAEAATYPGSAQECDSFQAALEAWRTETGNLEKFETASTFPGFWGGAHWVDEVLQLSSYGPFGSEVELRDSWRQLFVCWAYFQRGIAGPFGGDRAEEKLILFVTVAIELGELISREGACFLAWVFVALAQATHSAEDVRWLAYFAYCILLLSAYAERDAERGPWLKDLAVWVESVEAQAAYLEQRHDLEESAGEAVNSDFNVCWLLGGGSRSNDSLWLCLTRAILLMPPEPHPAAADEALRRLGEMLESGVLVEKIFSPSLRSQENDWSARRLSRILSATKKRKQGR